MPEDQILITSGLVAGRADEQLKYLRAEPDSGRQSKSADRHHAFDRDAGAFGDVGWHPDLVLAFA
jgi:hypothetical protein